MKKILCLLAFVPTLAFGKCLDLTGFYVCTFEVQGKSIDVNVEIQTIDNRYIVKNLDKGTQNDWVADGEEVRKVTPTSEGEILSSRTLSCTDKQVTLISKQAWWHDAKVNFDVAPDVQKLLVQTYFKDAVGNMLQNDHYVESYGGVDKVVDDDLTVCTKKAQK